ncbi:MAG: YggS family pyridoxal phosphate-dependent enzyme [Gemmatimonadota bacterium]|jgi:pyridoxal phosphate enzyme (YggS family)
MEDSGLRETVAAVRERIDRAARRAGRTDDVRLVAVTKGHPVERIRAALAAGLDRLGENRIGELEAKVDAVGRDAAEWHMIGHLQRNKARTAVPLFDRIHSIDSLRLARTLSKEAVRAERVVRGYMQVNVSGEEAKGGFTPDTSVDALGAIGELESVEIHGLMTMAPFTDDEDVLRETFAGTRRLLERLRAEVPDALYGAELSMGMSNDYEIAIEEGATVVRLGTVLFGERSQT